MCDEELSEGEAVGGDTSPLLSQQQPAGPLAARHCPEDSYNLVYIIFFLMGIGSLLPWNVFITAKQYWLYKLSNGSSPANSKSSTVYTLCSQVYNRFHTGPGISFRFSSRVRILFSLLVILVVFVVTTALVKVDMSGCRMQFFGGTLASVALVSGASNIFSGSVFGISGHFPMRISQAIISGQAMGGTLSALASIVDLAASSDVTDSALVYFITADVFTLVCIVMYLLLPRLSYSSESRSVSHSSSQNRVTTKIVKYLSCTRSESTSGSVPPLKPILKKTWVLGSCVFYVFFISIMIFPALSSGIQSMNKDSGSPWATTYFVPLTSFLLYNVADFCGRQVTAWLQVPGPTSRMLPLLVVSRSALVPLFMFCNYQPRYHLHSVFFAHDLFPVVFVCLLGISNGYLGTLPMIYGPKVVPRELAEPAGVVMSFFLTLGLAVGSAFSVALVHSI
uniref:Equilibrative nucleoside transporter 3-like n=1 Tax=Sinocyclocheilus anshuiensis TaxID=1608454 RepID=A0A671PIW5_9TELE